MAGEGAAHIQETVFPDVLEVITREGLADMYIDGLYGVKPQITAMIQMISQHQELVEHGEKDDPRRGAIIDTIWQMYQVTRVYRDTGADLIREYDDRFWQIEFSDLMDEMDFLDAELDERIRGKFGNDWGFQHGSGEFAMNLARMVILANHPDLLGRGTKKSFNTLASLAAAQNYHRQINPCMSLYMLLARISER